MFKIVVYIPSDHLETVKSAMFAAGAGRLDQYDHCCWQVSGQGQFRALAGSKPFIGQKGEIEKVDEFRVEMICEHAVIQPVIDALKSAHPYEHPAYDVTRIEDL